MRGFPHPLLMSRVFQSKKHGLCEWPETDQKSFIFGAQVIFIDWFIDKQLSCLIFIMKRYIRIIWWIDGSKEKLIKKIEIFVIYIQLRSKVYTHLFTHTLQNLQNVNYFTKIRGIIQNTCYCLFSTDLNKIFHLRDIYTDVSPQEKIIVEFLKMSPFKSLHTLES